MDVSYLNDSKKWHIANISWNDPDLDDKGFNIKGDFQTEGIIDFKIAGETDLSIFWSPISNH